MNFDEKQGKRHITTNHCGMHHVDNNSMYARTYDKSKRCPAVRQKHGIKTFKYTYQSKKITNSFSLSKYW